MPRSKKITVSPDTAKEQSVRRGSRQRIAKTRPDFVDPFSLRKKRTDRIESTLLSPVSPLSEEEQVEHQPQPAQPIRIKSVVLKIRQVPFKKRDYVREAWKSKLEAMPEEEARIHLSSPPQAPTPKVTPRLRRRRSPTSHVPPLLP